jgi:DnaJ-domain-containing protein 1
VSRAGYWWWEQYHHQKAIDWDAGGRATLNVLEAFFKLMAEADGQRESRQTASRANATVVYDDDEIEEAARVLGVSVDATADEIRFALRAKMRASRLHPDHGGDEAQAKRLIAAKNLLIERTKVRP